MVIKKHSGWEVKYQESKNLHVPIFYCISSKLRAKMKMRIEGLACMFKSEV